MPENNFSWNEFGDTFGNTVQDVIDGFGDTTAANAANSQAVANLNNAQAAAVLQRAENQKTLIKTIGLVLIIFVALVGIGYIVRPLLAKVKF